MYIIPKMKDSSLGSVPNAKQIAEDWVRSPHLRKDIKSAISREYYFDSEKLVIVLDIAKRVGREKATDAIQKRIVFYKEFEKNMSFWVPELSLVKMSSNRAEPTAYILLDSEILGIWQKSTLLAEKSGLNSIAKEHKRVADMIEHSIKFYMANDSAAKIKEVSWFLQNVSAFSLFLFLDERKLFNKQEILGYLKTNKFTAQEKDQIVSGINQLEQMNSNLNKY
ncbi:MAG: hypothetical protein NT051_06395 [Candidatus Micrarchaeota archaeon]|nr:hypothetical protein [Candidatus Micrarchaeota archaeon]